MEKSKLITQRKAKGFSQAQIAEKLCMDVSNYNRREKGQIKIPLIEWKKLAEIFDAPIEDIYEADETPVFINKDSVTVHSQGINNYLSVPEYLLETQRKYIEILEKEIRELKGNKGNV